LVLSDMVKDGLISDLELQPVFVLAPSVKYHDSIKKKPALRYIADFRYKDRNGNVIVEDVKGVQTETFKIKRHLLKHIFGIDILLT
jgi:hypothetical protein